MNDQITSFLLLRSLTGFNDTSHILNVQGKRMSSASQSFAFLLLLNVFIVN